MGWGCGINMSKASKTTCQASVAHLGTRVQMFPITHEAPQLSAPLAAISHVLWVHYARYGQLPRVPLGRGRGWGQGLSVPSYVGGVPAAVMVPSVEGGSREGGGVGGVVTMGEEERGGDLIA